MIGAWQSIVEGELGLRVRAATDRIAIALEAADREGSPTLAFGAPGIALFFAYLARTRHVAQHQDTAGALLDASIDAVASIPMECGLYDGFPGVAWSTEHLQGVDESRDLNEDIDGHLIEVTRTPWLRSHDLTRGIVGLGVYALERAHRSNARRLLAQIVDRLDECAQRTDDGLTWFTPPHRMSPGNVALYPDGCCDLGLAHGVPAVVAFLAACVAHSIHVTTSQRLLLGAVEWLLAQRQPPGTFDEVLAPNRAARPTRLAWCYGDPGVASALFLAGQAAARPDWQAEAIAVAQRAAHRPPRESGVVDAGLCHGAAGLVHIFNRFYQATGLHDFRDAARAWIERLLALQDPGRGVGGFWSQVPDPDRPGVVELRADPGFLQGAAGVGLTLLAAVGDVRPDWDRALLLSFATPREPAPR